MIPWQKKLTENGAVLGVLLLWVLAQNCAEAVIVDLLLVSHHEVPPALLAPGALHLVFVYGLGGVELGKVLAEVLVDVIVDLGQAKGAGLDLLEDGPVRLEVTDRCGVVVSAESRDMSEGAPDVPLTANCFSICLVSCQS